MGKIDVTFRRPVGWLDPKQLLKTGIKAAEAGLFGAFADRREVIAALSPGAEIATDPPLYDYSDKPEVWFDYICDTGDGWNGTYAIACLVGQPSLMVQGNDGPLSAPDFTILGGDEVYPTASLQDYQTRLIDPFYCANTRKPATGKPTVYALPGNHDWYDGLTSFMRLFLQENRQVGPWNAGQQRTYFAIRLRKDLWIWGVDVQLESDVDAPQTEYFENYAAKLNKDDRVILCTPEPSWVEGADKRLEGSLKKKNKTHDNLLHVEKFIHERGATIPLRIAGDLHHYARYEDPPGKGQTFGKSQLITCGGGGAFLHSTHPLQEDIKLKSKTFAPHYDRVTTYPTPEACRKLRWTIFGFPENNFWFPVTVGAIYALYAWVLGSASQIYLDSNNHEYLLGYFAHDPASWVCKWADVVRYSPLGLFLTLAIALGAAFYGVSFRRKVWITRFAIFQPWISRISWIAAFLGGLAHGALQLGAVVVLMGLVAAFWVPNFVALFAITFIGMVAGSFIMALYLLLANLLYGGHDEEVFSAQAIANHKCFARFHVTKDKVMVYPIGLETVPSTWKPAPEAKDIKISGTVEKRYTFDIPAGVSPIFVPEQGTTLTPFLIEGPIELR